MKRWNVMKIEVMQANDHDEKKNDRSLFTNLLTVNDT